MVHWTSETSVTLGDPAIFLGPGVDGNVPDLVPKTGSRTRNFLSPAGPLEKVVEESVSSGFLHSKSESQPPLYSSRHCVS